MCAPSHTPAVPPTYLIRTQHAPRKFLASVHFRMVVAAWLWCRTPLAPKHHTFSLESVVSFFAPSVLFYLRVSDHVPLSTRALCREVEHYARNYTAATDNNSKTATSVASSTPSPNDPQGEEGVGQVFRRDPLRGRVLAPRRRPQRQGGVQGGPSPRSRVLRHRYNRRRFPTAATHVSVWWPSAFCSWIFWPDLR